MLAHTATYTVAAALTVVPFNQGSNQNDVEALVDYIYMTLGLDLDYVIHIAAVPENGREIDGLYGKSEVQIVTRPTPVVLPLSQSRAIWK